jgi:Gpi18-like mannosyltransferase
MNKISEYIQKIPKEIIYTLQIFFVTRVALTIIGILSLKTVGSFLDKSLYDHIYSRINVLNVWGGWDTGWYTDIARLGYSSYIRPDGQATYGFFPLYPILIKIFNFIFQNYFISALIVSNLFLILAAIILYKLVKLDCDEKTSLRAIKYLFIFPGAFALSYGLSESLFLFLIILCIYFAKKRKWFLSGLAGMFSTLTKPFGIVMIIPILYEYFNTIESQKGKNILKILKDLCSIALIPLGLSIFAIYTYFLTGNIFAYSHIKETGWANHLIDPIIYLMTGLISANPFYVWQAVTALAVILLLIFFRKKIDFSYFLAGISIALFCLSTSGALYTMASMSRYFTAIFPLYVIFAKISENETINDCLMFFMLLLQGYLMIYWKI